MNDLSQGVLLTNEAGTATEIEYAEFVKFVNVGDKIKELDNSELTVVKKVYEKQISNNYVAKVYLERK
jgi:hypothetical protein